MIKNYFLLFVRNLRRQKVFSAINLLGLSVSIASTLIIYLYVRDEFSYDSFHKDADRIYRVNQTFIWGENNNAQFASTGPGVAYAMKEEIAEVELITSIHTPGDFIISYTQADQTVLSFEENKVLAADTNFFRMFNFRLVSGDAATVLEKPNTLVMTESTAKKYFGKANPIGKLVRLSGTNGQEQKTYEVTGIVQDLPDNSYIDFDILLSLKAYPIERLYWSWVWTQLETYVKLIPNADLNGVEAKVADIPRKRAEETLRRAFNTTYDEYIASGKKWELFLQPLSSIHLPDEVVLNRLNDSGNIQVIYSFIGAAVFIVILSCINFMNLSTAQFTRRLKEASVRKILGLGRKELTFGYFIEALVFCLLALIAAIGLAQVGLPQFNLITEKSLQLDLGSIEVWTIMIGIVVLMSVVSSSYPSMFLSSFHPVEAMKGKLKVGREGKSFRNGLVIFQFSISIVLIVCTGVVFQQLKYVSDKALGFNKENLMVIRHVETTNGESVRNDLLSTQGVVDASWCTSAPPSIFGGDTFSAEGDRDLRFPMNFTTADENYIPALDLQLKVGRNFSVDNVADQNSIIVNESTIRKIGWSVDESVIGKKIIYPGNENSSYEIIGVVVDFNYWSISNPIEPFGLFHIKNPIYPEMKQYLVVRTDAQSTTEMQAAIDRVQSIWKKHAANTPFDYTFVDEAFDATFKTQLQFGRVLTVMATLAIVIASLGLLGIIIYALEQRTKEIGIRKVSGASVWNILTLISRGYAKLIIIAVIIGAPVAWMMMSKWLEAFAYRVTPSPWIFIGSAAGVFFIAIVITSYHSFKAAMTNPVDVLKDE